MNFTKDGVYKLVELPNGLLLTAQDIVLKEMPNVEPLILADMGAMCSYLGMYLYARCYGQQNMQTAHEHALKEAQIVKVFTPGKPS